MTPSSSSPPAAGAAKLSSPSSSTTAAAIYRQQHQSGGASPPGGGGGGNTGEKPRRGSRSHRSPSAAAASSATAAKLAAHHQQQLSPQQQQQLQQQGHDVYECMPDILPSGSRSKGQGIETDASGRELPQGIEKVTSTSGGCQLQVTMLAAGFAIGPGGVTIKRIGTQCKCIVQSWSAKSQQESGRAVRVFDLTGSQRAVACAAHYIRQLVELYKNLVEGPCAGHTVSRNQQVSGPCGQLQCVYQPPPLSRMPSAARVEERARPAGWSPRAAGV